MKAGCYSVINPKEKKPDEKGILENWKLFHFQNWKFRKGGLLPLDNTEFKTQYVSGVTDEGSHDESLYQ